MDQPDNLCYLTRPLEICLWYMLGLEVSTTNDSLSRPAAPSGDFVGQLFLPRGSPQFQQMFVLLVDVKSGRRFVGLVNACEYDV